MSAADARRALPRGPHGLSREEVELSQRARLLQAATETVVRSGLLASREQFIEFGFAQNRTQGRLSKL